MARRKAERKKPTRAQRRLAKLSFLQFRRLSPEENIAAGKSPTARNYVPTSIKRVTKKTAAISARQYERKKARALHDMTPAQATEARKQGGLDYVSADQRERVAKAARTRVVSRVKRAVGRRETLPTNSPDKRRHGQKIALRRGDDERYQDLKRRRLAGEQLPIGDWVWMMDMGQYFGDPDVDFMRGSPVSFNMGFTA